MMRVMNTVTDKPNWDQKVSESRRVCVHRLCLVGFR